MEDKRPAEALKNTKPSVPLENLHAPEFFASWIKSAAFEGPNVHLTFVSQRWDHTIDAMREVVVGRLRLAGDVCVPAGTEALVVFAHGSGSSRLSPRNTAVAQALNEQGIATLLFDLLSADEGLDRTNVFDIPLLAERLVQIGRRADLRLRVGAEGDERGVIGGGKTLHGLQRSRMRA